jgi:thiol-disulfide isomerase/thioredoxin
MKWSRTIAVFAVSALALVLFANAPSGQARSSEFTASKVMGGKFTSKQLAGKATVMWFWTPWCTTCKAEAPYIARLAKKYNGKIQFVGVAGIGSVDQMKKFVTSTKVGGFDHLADLDGSIWARYGVVAQPSFAFITKNGQRKVVIGGLSESELDKRLIKLRSGKL